MKRFALTYVAPAMLLLVVAILPLVRGERTLVLRDVLNSHLNMKWAQAEALRRGTVPLVDIYRAGGQPLAGNPNAAPFYPDNLLALVGNPLWAENAHFWIHLLLAPFAFFWMARAFGLEREGSWAAALAYTFSGFFFSHLNFYNLIAGAALAPAFVAACLEIGRGGEDRRPAMAPMARLIPVALAVLWALLLLGGDPLLAAMALALGGAAFAFRRPWPRLASWALLAGALALGTVLALPQLVEFLRILPLSFRGHYGYAAKVATLASWDPRQAVEWLVPFFYGRPDLLGPGSFWGQRFFTGVPPFYFSLYPGLLVLALIAAIGRSRGLPQERFAIRFGLGAVVVGLFLALGRFNPLVEWIYGLGQGSLRYPVKFWPPVAIGTALLAGVGFERFLAPPAGESRPRGFRIALGILFAAFLAVWIVLTFFPGPATEWAHSLMPKRPLPMANNERLRWAGLCLVSMLALALFAGAAYLGRRRPALGGALALALHATFQLFFLSPLYPMDDLAAYLDKPPALAYVPKGSRVAHGSFMNLFRNTKIESGQFPAPTILWLERRAFAELFPFTGPIHGLRYELNVSPEGLDSFYTRMAQGGVKGAKDIDRVRLLAAWGIDRLLIGEPLAPATAARVRLLAEIPSFGRQLFVYEVLRTSPHAFLATRVVGAPHMNAAYQRLLEPEFDATTHAVVDGDGPPRTLGGGQVEIVADEAERFVAEINAQGEGLLVVQRATLPIYRAMVDGRPTEMAVANLHRIGIAVPSGRHRVEIATDRRPLALSTAVSGIGFLLLPALAWAGGWTARRAARPLRAAPPSGAEAESPNLSSDEDAVAQPAPPPFPSSTADDGETAP